ncbi:MAG: hypothetical protein Q8R08_05040, partial [bacterium]|nr:hypothetical protein [bacterium]
MDKHFGTVDGAKQLVSQKRIHKRSPEKRSRVCARDAFVGYILVERKSIHELGKTHAQGNYDRIVLPAVPIVSV